jgi:hypothetical protein
MQILEINTWVWLTDVGQRTGRPVTLRDLPDGEWDRVLLPGTDTVWLMGVWERSPFAREYARAHEPFVSSQRAALPDLTDADVIGSAYSVRRYRVDAALGGPKGLAAARAALARRGIRLLLDYVPNHVAPDHPWTTKHPERFLAGTDAELAADPPSAVRVGPNVLACGRDPYFPAWPEVVQLNAFSPSTRSVTIKTLRSIAEQCDGVRCDMAMLLMNDVVERTWGDRAGPLPDEEFWPGVIAAVKAHHPEFVFVAEAYWDLEWELQQQGFDLTYDKRLYDLLVHADADGLRGHLRADLEYQARMARFVENHDEPRVAATLTPEAATSALVTIATLPGAPLLHEGQETARRIRVPVTLGRRPDEPADHEVHDTHERVLRHVHSTAMREGEWSLCDLTGWPDNQSCVHLVGWAWHHHDRLHLVVVNASDHPADGMAYSPWPERIPSGKNVFTELLSGEGFERDGDHLRRDGLYVSLGPRAAALYSW